MGNKIKQRNEIVLYTMIKFADADMTVAKSIRDVARAAGMSFHPARMAIRELEAMGKLEVLFRGKQGTGPSKYKINATNEDVILAQIDEIPTHKLSDEHERPKINHWDKLRRYIIKLETLNKEQGAKIKALREELQYYKQQEETIKKIVADVHDDELSATVAGPRRVVVDGQGHCLGLK